MTLLQCSWGVGKGCSWECLEANNVKGHCDRSWPCQEALG